MAYLTNAEKIEEHTGFDAKASLRVFGFVASAKKEIIGWIGADKYDELTSAASPDAEEAARSESFLSLYFGMPFLNLRPTQLGGFSRQIGWDDRGEQLMSKSEMEQYRTTIYNMAKSLIEDLITDNENEDHFIGNGFGFMAVKGN